MLCHPRKAYRVQTRNREVTRYIYRLADWVRHYFRKKADRAKALGWRGEDLAHRFLQQNGYIIVARNYRAQPGGAEVDIIARDGQTLVFVEVKSRSTDEYGSPDRAVGIEKQQHLLRAALEYARRADVDWQLLRFDIVTIVFHDPPAITHLQDILPLRQSNHFSG